jgi:membrane protein DedA with SNARE-associated domain
MDSGIIYSFIENYGLIAVFILIMLEYACFPLPSEIVLPFAGAYAAIYGVPFYAILFISIAAGLCGCLICYLIGFFGGAALLERLGRRFHNTAAGFEASKQWFDRYGSLSVIIARVLPLCRTYISFVSGLSRQKLIKFLALSAVGISVWNLVLVGLGFKLAAHWDIIALYARRYTFILLPVVILIVFIIFCQIKKLMSSIKTKDVIRRPLWK